MVALGRGSRRLPPRLLLSGVALLIVASQGLLHYCSFDASSWSPSPSPLPQARLRNIAENVTYIGQSMPPLYPDFKVAEAKLPQHDAELPFPEGKHARFINFGNHMWGLGLNNLLQECLLNSYIAYLAGRTYVFPPITWDPFVTLPYVPINISNSHLKPTADNYRASRVPLTAYISGPTSGAPWPEGNLAPRSVSEEWWDQMCPQEARLHINTTQVNAQIGVDFDRDEGLYIVQKWAEYLQSLEAPCVNIQWGNERIIDFLLLVTPRLLSLWPGFSASPVLTELSWSPVVLSGVYNNLPLLQPIVRWWDWALPLLPPTHPEIVPGLISIHLRRGDFLPHCHKLSKDLHVFQGWNQLEFLPDRMAYPDAPFEEKMTYFMRRCWPSLNDIIARLEELRRTHDEARGVRHVRLHTVFVATNADSEWLDVLKEALLANGWATIVTTRDLDLTWEESGVESAIDMELASRAEAFVGNGFSSMSSTVTRIRLVRGLDPSGIHYW